MSKFSGRWVVPMKSYPILNALCNRFNRVLRWPQGLQKGSLNGHTADKYNLGVQSPSFSDKMEPAWKMVAVHTAVKDLAAPPEGSL